MACATDTLEELRLALQCQPATYRAKIAEGHTEIVRDRLYWQGDSRRFAVAIHRMTLLPNGKIPDEIDEVGMAAYFHVIDPAEIEGATGITLTCREERAFFTFVWEAGSGDVRLTSMHTRALVHFCDEKIAHAALRALNDLIVKSR